MALDQSALLELLDVMRSADGGELMRRLLAAIMQLLVDAEATAVIGAERHERTDARMNQRNGTRDKLVATATGDLTIKIPKIRTGSFFPSLLSPRRRVDVALHAVVMQAWVEGVSTRKVDDLVAALGVESGISKSEVSRICAQLDVDVAAWRERSLAEQAMPYVFLDATYCKARVGGRVVSRAVVIATAVSADGRREVLGVDVGDSESEDFWTEFLRGLRKRGLHGVQLVISDAHRGLTNAIGSVCAFGRADSRCSCALIVVRHRPLSVCCSTCLVILSATLRYRACRPRHFTKIVYLFGVPIMSTGSHEKVGRRTTCRRTGAAQISRALPSRRG
jgi:putative transposase